MIMETRLKNSVGTINKQDLVAAYDQHSQELYRYAYRLAGDSDVAEDCVAETFSRYLRLVREGRGPTENVRAYLYRMARASFKRIGMISRACSFTIPAILTWLG
jgi:RNA polymerase sigma-70 factor (ECF subfamily)